MDNSINKLAEKIIEATNTVQNNKPKPFDTKGIVRRVEGDIAYIHFEGGVEETPVALTINAKPGDSVMVRVAGGNAWIVGNGTAPPTDDRVANVANKRASAATDKANIAELAAKNADETAQTAIIEVAKKSKIFHTNDDVPDVPYNVGDMWIDNVTEIQYVLTTDETVDADKTYYVQEEDDEDIYYVEVENPVDEDLYLYYEKQENLVTYTKICISANRDEFVSTDWEIFTDNEAIKALLLSDIDTAIESFNKTTDDIQETLTNIQEKYDTQITNLNDEYVRTELLNTYMQLSTYTEDDKNYPLLILGSEDSTLQANLRADALQFTDGGNVVAHISGQSLHIQGTLLFGDFGWFKRNNGHLSLKYIGA